MFDSIGPDYGSLSLPREYAFRMTRIPMDGAGHGRHKNPVCTGFPPLLRISLDPHLMEAAGDE